MIAQDYLKDPFQRSIAFSVAAHIVFVLFFALKSFIFPSKTFVIPDAIRVDMKALPEKPQQQAQRPPKQTKPRNVPSPKNPKKPKPKPKTDHKSAQEKAMEALEQRNALEQIKSSINKPKQNKAAATDLKPNQPTYKGEVVTSGNSFTGIAGLEAEEYWGQLKSHLQNYWSLPEWLINTPLSASVVVKISETGQVLNANVYRSSGNTGFDDAALKAVQAASPFPMPPERIRDIISDNWMIFNFPE